MYAIVETSGRQIQLEAGRFVDIDMVPKEPGDEFVFEQVLMLVNGKDSQIGKPFVEGAKVTGRVLSHGKQKKIIVYHQRPKKGTRKKVGHRQGFTRVLINSISLKDQVLAEARAAEKPANREKAEKPAKAAAKTEAKPKQKADAKPEKKAPKASAKSEGKQAGKEAAKPAKKAASKKAE